MHTLVLSAAVGFGIALAITPILIRLCERKGWGRRTPALHHTHKKPVPRIGGLVLATVFVAVEIGIAIYDPAERVRTPQRTAAFFCCLGMFALGFLDDLEPLGAKRKLLGQVCIASVAWALGIGIEYFKVPFTDTVLELEWWGALLTVFWLVGMTNLINLVDGVDGLAAGISLMVMALTAYVGAHGGHFELVAAGMAGGLLGFLRYNFPPARIYLGDGGAYFLGFQIGLFSLIDSQKGTVFAVLIAPLFVLVLPIIDTTLAILRRGVHGLSIFRADRQHIHHRLLRVGLSRRQVVLFSYSLTLLFLFLGLVTFWTRGQFVAVLLGVAVLILLFCAGQFSFSREWFAVGRVMGNSLEMRQEIRYALLLARWLVLEGNRKRTDLELWEDLVFVVRKLGFNEVKFTDGDGQWHWQAEGDLATAWSASYRLQGGRVGTLALSSSSGIPGKAAIENGSVEIPSRGIDNDRLFEILGELVAEAWGKTANSCQKQEGERTALKFETIPGVKENSTDQPEDLPEMILTGDDEYRATGQ